MTNTNSNSLTHVLVTLYCLALGNVLLIWWLVEGMGFRWMVATLIVVPLGFVAPIAVYRLFARELDRVISEPSIYAYLEDLERIPIEEAKRQALAILETHQDFRSKESDLNDWTPPWEMPESVSTFFAIYSDVHHNILGYRIARSLVSESQWNMEFIKIGEDPDEGVEFAIKPKHQRVYYLDSLDTGEPSFSFPSIFHLILYIDHVGKEDQL